MILLFIKSCFCIGFGSIIWILTKKFEKDTIEHLVFMIFLKAYGNNDIKKMENRGNERILKIDAKYKSNN